MISNYIDHDNRRKNLKFFLCLGSVVFCGRNHICVSIQVKRMIKIKNISQSELYLGHVFCMFSYIILTYTNITCKRM